MQLGEGPDCTLSPGLGQEMGNPVDLVEELLRRNKLSTLNMVHLFIYFNFQQRKSETVLNSVIFGLIAPFFVLLCL